MDERIKKHADIIVNHSTNIQEGDMVVISASPEATDLVQEIYSLIGEIGAVPHLKMRFPEATSRYYESVTEDKIFESEHSKALWEKTDVSISIRGSSNTKSMINVPSELQIANSKLNNDTREIRLDTRWLLTQYPTDSSAQEADMSTREYADFVYDAVIKDWDEQKEFQSQMCDILNDGKKVRIVSGDKTDITMRIDGMNAINDYGEHNMPAGEVFTAPVKESVNGSVLFDMPLLTQGRELQDVYLEFEDGKVVDYSASKNEDVIESILNTDDGSRYLGELGIGMNRGIDEFTYNMLFDEKMGDTIHLALGRAYKDNVGEDREQNLSAVHLDMIVDMSENSYIEIDGEKVQENGNFIFE
jgi:aminopeptidase